VDGAVETASAVVDLSRVLEHLRSKGAAAAEAGEAVHGPFAFEPPRQTLALLPFAEGCCADAARTNVRRPPTPAVAEIENAVTAVRRADSPNTVIIATTKAALLLLTNGDGDGDDFRLAVGRTKTIEEGRQGA